MAGRPGRGRAARLAARLAPGRSQAVRPGLPGGAYRPLSEQDLERISATAFAVLANIGLSAVTDEIREIATAKGAHFNAHGRLCFPRPLVEDMLAVAAQESLAADDPRDWLERMNRALETRNYDGTFFHLSDGRVETMRVVHRMRAGSVIERLMSLD